MIFRYLFVLFFWLFLWAGMVNSASSEQGEKIKITTVRFDGNLTFSDSRLYQLMISRPSSFLKRYYFYPRVFEDDLNNLQLFYRQNGFLEALVTEHSVDIDSAQSSVKIFIKIVENERTSVEGISIFGNKGLSDDLLLQQIKIKAGEPLDQKKIEEATIRILTLYAERGYLDGEVVPDIRVDPLTHRALVDFVIKERAQYFIHDIRFNGLEKTKKNVVQRDLSFKAGQIVDYSRLLESQRKLYLTGLFQSVFVRPQPTEIADSSQKDILIEVKENQSISVNASIGYGSVERLRGRVEFFNTNLRGTARKFSFSSELSAIKAGLETSVSEPWTFGTPWTTDINLLTMYQEEPGYNLNRVSGKIALGRMFFLRSQARLTYTLENVKFKKVKVLDIPLQSKSKLNGLNITLIHDTRNNLFNTSYGTYLDWSNEYISPLSSERKGFFRTILRMKKFHLVKATTVLAAALQVGWIGSSGGIEQIPLNERFYTGGPNSLRGFEYQKVGPLDENRIPKGGILKLESNLELRRALYKIIGGVLFIDFGNVWSHTQNFSIKTIRSNLGLGIRLNTPIGLARLDYGFNVSPNTNEKSGRIYFSMGQVF